MDQEMMDQNHETSIDDISLGIESDIPPQTVVRTNEEPVAQAQAQGIQVITKKNPISTEQSKEDKKEDIVKPAIGDTKFEVTPDTQDKVDFDDDKETDKNIDAEYNEMIRQYNADDDSSVEAINFDKTLLGIPLSSVDDIEKKKREYFAAHRNDFIKRMNDGLDPYTTMDNAQRNSLGSFFLELESLKRLPAGTVVKSGARGLKDSKATVMNRYKDKEKYVLSGSEGYLTFTSITGGVRRLRLYNSGIYLSFRNLTINNLFQFHTEFQTTDYEMGKDFGGFYYLYSDFYIRKYIIETLFPLAICGSNYNGWRDMDRLLRNISVQDFDVILWHMATMMHPNGVNIGFVCGAPNCSGHVEPQLCDLSKLRLDNNTLINDDMYALLKKTGWISDEDLEVYRDKSNLKGSIEFQYKIGIADDPIGVKKWKINLKQAMLSDWLAVGEDFLTELKRHCDPKEFRDVTTYLVYNINRAYIPWIESFELTVFDPADNIEKTFVLNNDGTEDNTKTVYMLLDEFQTEVPEFSKKVEEYINDTRITHIAYYFPECPECHTVPENSYKGYVPYDCLNNFFTLARTKLVQDISKRAEANSSKNTQDNTKSS